MLVTVIIVGLIVFMVAGSTAAQWPNFATRYLRHLLTTTTIAAIAITAGAFWLAPSSHSTSVIEVGLGIALLCALGLGAFLFGINLAGFDPDAETIAGRLAIDETSRRLLSRWTHRVRWRRWIGGTSGVALALFSNNSEWLLPAGVAGAAFGSISAELHLCRPSPSARRVVSLERRQVRAYLDRWSTAGLAAVVAIAVAGGLWIAIDQRRPMAPMWMLVAVGVVAFAAGLIWQVVHRRRPALSPELRAADDLLRRLAISNGIAKPMMSVGLIAVAAGFGSAGYDDTALIVGLLAVAVWWRSRRGGLDYVLKHPVRAAHLLVQPKATSPPP